MKKFNSENQANKGKLKVKVERLRELVPFETESVAGGMGSNNGTLSGSCTVTCIGSVIKK